MTNITGDRKKSTYDPKLAERVNKEFEKMPELPVAEPVKTANKLEDFVYVPSIKLYFSRKLVHNKVNWYGCHNFLQANGERMPTIIEFVELLRYAIEKEPNIYKEITEVREPWRGEWLDAFFEKRQDGMYILTQNKKKYEKMEDYLKKDAVLFVSKWIEDPTTQGLPRDADENNGSLWYEHPKHEYVAKFLANSTNLHLNCESNPKFYKYIGVRRVRESLEGEQ
jgi:hypothetical protein